MHNALSDKSLLTNLISVLVALAGWLVPGTAGELLLTAGLYALSGAFTNWLAIYMLFEKVPGFYGSGVVPLRFEEFKAGIRDLVMQQFFNPDNVRQFFGDTSAEGGPHALIDTLARRVNFDKAFDGLVDVILQSSFAMMLKMVGGEKALQPLRDPFVRRMRQFVAETAHDRELLSQLAHHSSEGLLARVERIVDKRLDELTPQLVKEIVQRMIQKHLGWLVVWGGVVGGLIGIAVELLF